MTLIERLRQVVGETTRYYVNPDGPEAADEIERLREALRKIVERDWQFNKDGKLGKIYGPCAVIARAALKGSK